MRPQVRAQSSSIDGGSPSVPTGVAKRDHPSASTRFDGPSLASPMCYKELIKGLGLEFEAKPSSWRKAVDHSTETVVFFQLDLGGDRPRISKSIVIRPEPYVEKDVEMLCLVPSVFTEDSLLPNHSLHVRNAMGRTYLLDGTDLMKLSDYMGALDVDDETGSEPEQQPCVAKNVRSRSPTPYPSSLSRQISDIRSGSEISAVTLNNADDLSETEKHSKLRTIFSDNVILHETVSSDDQGSVQSEEICERPWKRKTTAVSTGHAESGVVGKHPRGQTLQADDAISRKEVTSVSGTCRRGLRTRGIVQRESAAAASSSSQPLSRSKDTVAPVPRKRQHSANPPKPSKRGRLCNRSSENYRVWHPKQGKDMLKQEDMQLYIRSVAAKGYKCWEYPCCGSLQFGGSTNTVYRHIYGQEKHCRARSLNACKHYRQTNRRRYLLGYPPAGEIRTFYLMNSQDIDVSVRHQEQVYKTDTSRSMCIAKADTTDATTLTDRVEALQADGRLSAQATIDEILDCLDAQDRLAAQIK